MERLGLITVDMQNAIASISGDKDFFYGDNNSIEIKIENVTEPIGNVCYYAANSIGQVFAGTAVLTDGKYLIDKENMDCVLNIVGEVIIQIQIYNTENQRITCTDTVSIESLLNYDRKKTEVLTPSLQVNLAELLELAEKIANGEFDVTPESGTDGKDGVTFTPYVSSAGIISWTNDGGLKNPNPVNIMGPEGPAGPQGIQGNDGQDGKDGTSILSIARKSEDGNIIVVTLTDASVYEIEIPTVQGEAGKDGQDGKDGSDYILTDADKEEIAGIATSQLSSEIGNISAVLDQINGEVI